MGSRPSSDTSPHLALRLLGPPKIELDSQPLTSQLLAKAQALLIYLALTQQPQARTNLMVLLWGDSSKAAAQTSLRQVLANLRHPLAHFLRIERQIVGLQPDANIWVDTLTFEQQVAHSLAQPDKAGLEAALRLYRGELLSGFDVRQAPDFERWLYAEQERLHQLAIRGLEALATARAAQGQLEVAIASLRRVLVLDPWREETHRSLMVLLVRSGQRSAALQQYDLCCKALADELGVEPSQATTTLYEQIRAQSAGEVATPLVALVPPLTPTSPSPTRHTLPLPPTPMIGRREELNSALARLRRANTWLVTLSGPGGSGKTRLALEIAWALVDDFADGLYFVDLTALTNPGLVLPTIAHAIGLQETPARSLNEVLASYLHDRRVLLLLDNFEQVVDAAPHLAGLHNQAPGLKLLVTSRTYLRLRGEIDLPVPPLPLPEPAASLIQIAQTEAVQLFVARIQDVQLSFILNDENAETIAELCRRLDGLPLALELAAVRTKVFSPQALLSRLANPLTLLTRGPRDLPDRQQTLRATIAWSYDLLSPGEQRFFRRMSVFLGGFTLEAAQAVGAGDEDLGMDFLDALAGLVDKSLVRPLEPGSGEARFGMLETIREYGLEQLQACGEAAEVQRQHAEYFLKLAAVSETHAHGTQQAVWLDRLEAELGNLRAALAWSKADAGRIELGLRLSGYAYWLWFRRGPIGEARAWLAGLLAVPESSCYPAARAVALEAAGFLATRLADYAAARTLLEESIVLWRKIEDRYGLGRSLWGLGDLEKLENHFERAAALFEESLALLRAVGSQWGVAFALGALGDIALHQSDYAKATALYEDSLALHRELGNLNGIAYVLNASGRAAQLQRKYRQAQSLHEESLTLYREFGASSMIAWVLTDLGNIAQSQGEVGRAKTLYKESLILSGQLGVKLHMARSLEGLAGAACQEGQFEQAARLSGTAERIFNSIGTQIDPILRADNEQNMAAVRAQIGKEAFAGAWAAGQAMMLDQAVEFALAG